MFLTSFPGKSPSLGIIPTSKHSRLHRRAPTVIHALNYNRKCSVQSTRCIIHAFWFSVFSLFLSNLSIQCWGLNSQLGDPESHALLAQPAGRPWFSVFLMLTSAGPEEAAPPRPDWFLVTARAWPGSRAVCKAANASPSTHRLPLHTPPRTTEYNDSGRPSYASSPCRTTPAGGNQAQGPWRPRPSLRGGPGVAP